ncbi:hypothetical protein [Pseudoclavibacter sp. JSM 162008]|uniref:hypothetical protein n=1 Tax=Pseudoclavibacter sp. JSM 162008 TaxID=3229855 RepID=UPI003525001D
MTNEIWCIAGGENGADRRLADALLRGGSTVAIVGRDVAPFALLVDDYADAIMPVELTATTPQALAELRESIELNLGEVTHFGVLVGELGEGTAEQVAERLLGKLQGAGSHGVARVAERAHRWPADAQLILVREAAAEIEAADQLAENADIEERIRVAAEQSGLPVPAICVRTLEELIRGAAVVAPR